MSAILAGLAVVSAYNQITGSRKQAKAARAQAAYERGQAIINAKLAEINASDALARGEEQLGDYEVAAKRLKGTQVSSLAAQGVEIDSGSAAQIRYETDKQIDTDKRRIKNNAWREAWGYELEGRGIGMQSAMNSRAAENQASNYERAGQLGGVTQLAIAGVRGYEAYKDSQESKPKGVK